MNLTTKTAQRLREIKEGLKNNYGLEHTDEYKMYGERNAIISFKNELKEILDDKYPNEPILKYYERLYVKLMTLKTEIESEEKQ